ncbi:Protein of unknown function (DUF732) [Mycolicibacterium chubuense NBB4]|uniref:DUF732 domain-containing protein n=1 Tax=Mycolicibacterium chubuense (strain NBB4) TaxID=710421 RepID=I4BNI4_MYCCN|nr:DUF732 domain-containing protein [Mycolicibacterium chubuense]AFM18841.1 Protein of unknown function (DUF732) [Mycolicibacterium chubuense NBB4]
MRATIIMTAVLAGSVLATVWAAPAFADDTDDVFIDALDSEGIPFSTTENAITLADAVCDYVAAGQARDQVAVEIMGPANWTAEQSGLFVGAATRSYCPS